MTQSEIESQRKKEMTRTERKRHRQSNKKTKGRQVKRLHLRVGGVECIVNPTLLLGLGYAAGQTVRRLHIPRRIHLITSINSGTDSFILIWLNRIRIFYAKLYCQKMLKIQILNVLICERLSRFCKTNTDWSNYQNLILSLNQNKLKLY